MEPGRLARTDAGRGPRRGVGFRRLGVAALAGGLLWTGIGFEATSASARPTPAERVPLGRLYRDGPPPGFSGGFGESTCHACHFDAEVNEPPGSVAVSGVPDRYSPGETYPLTITLTRPGMVLGGFQLTARFEGGGAQAGTIAPAAGEEERVVVTESGGVLYAYHRVAGTLPVAPDTARWVVLWTAPGEPTGAVLFHVAANAANGDDLVDGDYVYAVESRAEAGVTGPVEGRERKR